MSRMVRNSLLLLVTALLVTSFSVSALGASEGEETGDGAGSTTTTVDSGLNPAVEVGGEQTEPPKADWTYRYLIPTGLVLAALIILLTAVKYFTDVVRKRYRIVE